MAFDRNVTNSDNLDHKQHGDEGDCTFDVIAGDAGQQLVAGEFEL